MRPILIAASLTLAIGVTGAAAHHKPGHHIPPGQAKKMLPPSIVVVAPPPEVEMVCLVTTDTPGDPYAPVVLTAWLPRDIAEGQAGEDKGFIIYHPDFNTEDGCLGF
jgi:hypothetical protein